MESDRVLYSGLWVTVLEKGIATPSRAFMAEDALSLRIRIPRQVGTTSATLTIFCDADETRTEYPVRILSLDKGCDVCEVSLPALPVGLYYIGLTVESAVGRVGIRRTDVLEHFSLYKIPGGERVETPLQLLISEFRYPAPEWLYGGVIYHVFVDRFCKVGEIPPKKGTVINPDWENGIPQYPAYPGAPLANNMFFGGNLYGVAEKFDYLKSLSVNCIYLSPIFDAASNHKYDTGNYMAVDEMFGGEDALLHLLREAEKRDMRVILDGVFNHTGADSLYFNRYGNYDSVGAYQSKKSPYYEWFDFQKFPNKYTAWWGIEILPRMSPDVPSCRRYFTGEGGVIPHWMKKGIAGFRLDVADELSDDFIADIKRTMQGIRKDSLLYGEVWEDASQKIAYDRRRRYYQGEELDGVMNYPLRTGLIDYFRAKKTDALRYALTYIIYNAPKRIRDAQMNLIGTHDTERILTALAGDARGKKTNDELAVVRMTKKQRQKGITLLSLAYLALATLPGVPAIFYGDEVGMEGYGDPFNRLPFPWHKIEKRLLAAYQEIGAFRRSQEVYKTGDYRLLQLDENKLAFLRTDGKKNYVTVINRNETDALTLRADRRFVVLYGEEKGKRAEALTLPPLSDTVVSLPAEGNIELI